MNFWRRDIKSEPEQSRADVIIQKKRRKQDPKATGLGAVAIPRVGTRTVHQRNEDRHFLEGTMATAIIAEEEHEVRILNLSSNGVMISYDGLLEIGQNVRIAIEECAPITTAVRWLNHGKVGLEFAAETVILAKAGVQDFIIKTISREKQLESYNPDFTVGPEQRGVEKRHHLVWVGKLNWDNRDATVRLRNISASGAMVSLSAPASLSTDFEVELALNEMERIPARVCWSAGEQFGLEFSEDFDVAKLIAIACAELAPPEEPETVEEAVEDYPDDQDGEDFNSLRVRLANRGEGDRKPVSVYSRLSLEEVYDTLHPQAEDAETTSEESGES